MVSYRRYFSQFYEESSRDPNGSRMRLHYRGRRVSSTQDLTPLYYDPCVNRGVMTGLELLRFDEIKRLTDGREREPESKSD
jgi:hypothetical protein